jgi:TonB-dependent starch-binding outer membrane protein SusC
MKNIALFLLLLLCCSTMYAQQKIQVTGKVSDESGNPLPGASVIVKNSTIGTQSNFDGNYTLDNVPSDGILVVSYIGFKTVEKAVNGNTILNVILLEDAQSLDEVVVVGYGELKVKDLTSAITTIKTNDIVKTPTNNAMQALQGKVAGLQVVSKGSPGDSPTIRVRGIGSYPGQSNETPLYVVDGMFYDNIDFLNTSDIASISVLKDASAAAIYGVKAANGVIIVETKSGQFNKKAEISYDGYYGYQVAQNVLKMANAEQFTNMALESGSPADAGYILEAMQRYGRSRVNPNVPDVNTDWYKEILRPAVVQNHSISVSGGSEKASYSIGTSYFEQEGILDMKNEYERFNLRSKLDFKATDWFTVGGNVIFSNATKYNQENGAWFEAYYAVPIMPVLDEQSVDAWPTQYASAENLGYRGGKNPFPLMDFNNNQQKVRKVLANIYMNFDIIPDKLSFKTTYNHSYITSNERNVNLPYFISLNAQRSEAFINKNVSTSSYQIWDNVFTFKDSFGDHNINAMAGTSYRDNSWSFLKAKGTDFPTLGGSNAGTIITEDVGDDGFRQYGLSYFGRVSYNYKDKYLVYGTMRADGSSKYQEKWGYFPTVGLGWVASQEEFLAKSNVIDFLKIRASWGELGNDNVPASDGANTTSLVTTAIDDILTTGTVTSSTFDWLRWEVIEEMNIGFTSRLFDNRLSVDADYFIRDTKNAIIPVNVPSTGQIIRRNNGEIRNSGFEFAVNWNNQISDDLSYTIGANFSTLKNEVMDLYGQEYIDGGSAEFRQRSIVGDPILSFYGYETVGVYQNDAEIQADPIAIDNGLVPGDFKYNDTNGDGIIDGDDRTVLGSFLPSFSYGANIGINYKNFEFSASLMGQTGNKILNRKRGEIIWTSDGNLDADLAINRWNGEGTSNSYPSSAGLRKGWNQKMSNYFVEDGSFFRVQNIQLAYNVKSGSFLGTQMPDTRISFTADRPLTVFSYNGFNPEVSDGIDRQTYPIPAVYTLGLSIKF